MRLHYRCTREDFAVAVPLFRRALELDPSAWLPRSGIAHVRLLEALRLWADKPREARDDRRLPERLSEPSPLNKRQQQVRKQSGTTAALGP